MLECAIHPITYRGKGILATVVKNETGGALWLSVPIMFRSILPCISSVFTSISIPKSIAILVNNAFKTVQQSAKDKEDICRRADARQRYLTQDFTL